MILIRNSFNIQVMLHAFSDIGLVIFIGYQ